MKLLHRCAVLALVLGAVAADAAPESSAGPGAASHDFDFNVGIWHTRIERVLDPFSGGAHTATLEGTVTVRKVWGGRAQLEEIEADGPKGHWEGLTLFLYNPKSHQWTQSYIGSKTGDLEPPLIGSFKDGRGELIAQDTFDDRSILVRGTWSEIESDSHRFEESFSDDGGRTWNPAFIANLTREPRAAPSGGDAGGQTAGAPPFRSSGAEGGDDAAHAFDFDVGVWKTHSSRLMHPLTGSHDWADMDGVSVVSKVWNGRANLAEFEAQGPAGHVELLALRWYNPQTHQWNLDFATPNVGVLGIPGVGEFHNGRGEFYDQEMIGGRAVLVRFSIWGINSDTAQSEQAFSTDGGKTWETNWINKYTRMKP
jgi:hypothetical protein